MDEDELRKSLIEANREKSIPKERAADKSEYLGDLPALLKNEAQKIQALFGSATRSGERHELETRYGQLDGWLGRLREFDALEDPEEEARLQGELRATVLEEFRRWERGSAHREHLERIEKGRTELQEKGKPGAGAATSRRIKDEIEYLINNYAPSNEHKIEALIDKWRRSGDPAYDPNIKMKLRSARTKKSATDYPL